MRLSLEQKSLQVAEKLQANRQKLEHKREALSERKRLRLQEFNINHGYVTSLEWKLKKKTLKRHERIDQQVRNVKQQRAELQEFYRVSNQMRIRRQSK